MSESKQSNTTNVGASPAGGQLGTFAGVFTPSILTILGLILFLRMGYVVGAVGLGLTLVMILIANSISVLTSISLSTIATNLRVKRGGDYYLISRTLGVEFGGALGLVLYLAQSVSIAFYALGFGEAVSNLVPSSPEALPQIVAALAVGCLFVLAWLGADAATRFQYVVMGILSIALFAFFWGAASKFDPTLAQANWSTLSPSQFTGLSGGDAESSPSGFWIVFAIFFPAVTGFTQGVSMSGDLKAPARSLPLGTFLAVGVSAVVYLVAAVLLSGSVARGTLVSDFGAMRHVSLSSALIDAGVIAATLSSALASYLGAPRILQSLAHDRVFPILNPFAKGEGPTKSNPRRGVLLSTVIAGATIAIGDLNMIAPIVSMFFLISYGLINYATFAEAKSNSPSFRPTFRFFNPNLSLIGALACGVVMLFIQPTAAAIALGILFVIYTYIAKTNKLDRWADSGRSSLVQEIRTRLLRLTSELEHPRDWRPCIIAFSDNEGRRERLIRFASWLEGGSGFTTVVRVLEGKGAEIRQERLQAELALRAEIQKKEMKAFGRVINARDLETSIPVILQSHGLGNIRANTVVVNWFDRSEGIDSPGLRLYGHYLQIGIRYQCHSIISAISTEELQDLEATPRKERVIDVWFSQDAEGHLMLLLAYLMTRSTEWQQAKIRVLSPPLNNQSADATREELQTMLRDVRITAEPQVIQPYDRQALIETSRDSSMVFLPFLLRDAVPTDPFGQSLDEIVRSLKLVAFVNAANDVELDVAPEAGPQGAIADARDAVGRRARALRNAEKELEKINREREIESTPSSPASESKATEKSEEAVKRVARARANVQAARKTLEELLSSQPATKAPGKSQEP